MNSDSIEHGTPSNNLKIRSSSAITMVQIYSITHFLN